MRKEPQKNKVERERFEVESGFGSRRGETWKRKRVGEKSIVMDPNATPPVWDRKGVRDDL